MTPELVTMIIDYENNELSGNGIVLLFSELIANNLFGELQGSYGRSAEQLVNDGWLDWNGNILRTLERYEDEDYD